jgi:positive regulator of sigma E activity
VEVEIRPVDAVGAAFLIFILPLIAALGGGFGGYQAASAIGWTPAGGAIILGLVSFILSFLLLRQVERMRSKADLAQIVRILPDEEPAEGRR